MHLSREPIIVSCATSISSMFMGVVMKPTSFQTCTAIKSVQIVGVM